MFQKKKKISACHGKYSILICFALCFPKFNREDILLFILTKDKKCLTSTASPSVQHQEVADSLSLQKRTKKLEVTSLVLIILVLIIKDTFNKDEWYLSC